MSKENAAKFNPSILPIVDQQGNYPTIANGPVTDSSPETPRIISVKILNHNYRIKGRPLLIKALTDLVNDEIKKVSNFSPGLFEELDISVQASFHLAYNLYKCKKELEVLSKSTKEAEEKINQLITSINQNLDKKV